MLAAGRSTRLHPLTSRIAKPALPFVGRTILDRVLDGLAAAGVVKAIVNVHHAPATVREVVRSREDRLPHVTLSDESGGILGTAGALIPVKGAFSDGGPFFIVNGDCVHAIDYGALLDDHLASGASATLAVRDHGVPGFGSLRAGADGTLERFSVPTTGERGEHHFLSVQVVSPDLLDVLPAQPRQVASFTEWYPAARQAGKVLRIHVTHAEWHALDTPSLYLAGTRDFLARREMGPWIQPGAWVDDTARLDEATAVHAGCVVSAGARLTGTVLLPGARVGADAALEDCLVGFGEVVPPGALLSDSLVASDRAP